MIHLLDCFEVLWSTCVNRCSICGLHASLGSFRWVTGIWLLIPLTFLTKGIGRPPWPMMWSVPAEPSLWAIKILKTFAAWGRNHWLLSCKKHAVGTLFSHWRMKIGIRIQMHLLWNHRYRNYGAPKQIPTSDSRPYLLDNEHWSDYLESWIALSKPRNSAGKKSKVTCSRSSTVTFWMFMLHSLFGLSRLMSLMVASKVLLQPQKPLAFSVLRSLQRRVQEKLLQSDLPRLIQTLRQAANEDLKEATGPGRRAM